MEVKFYSAKTYLLKDSFAETKQFFLSNQWSSQNRLQTLFYVLNNKIELSLKLQMSEHFHKILQMLTKFNITPLKAL